MSGPNWQDTPDWLVFAVRASHGAARKAGKPGAGEDDVTRLASRLVAEDPEFVRILAERYVRSLVRAPKPRRREKKNASRDRLLAECARLRAEGMSLRAIAEAKGIGRQTVANHLAEWDVRRPEMPASLTAMASPQCPDEASTTAAAWTPRMDTATPNVIPIRRPA